MLLPASAVNVFNAHVTMYTEVKSSSGYLFYLEE